jgi:cation transport ATPase
MKENEPKTGKIKIEVEIDKEKIDSVINQEEIRDIVKAYKLSVLTDLIITVIIAIALVLILIGSILSVLYIKID